MKRVRTEWRGDLFASELSSARARLARFPILPRPFAHTITVFLHPAEEPEWALDRAIRLRTYDDLLAITEENLSARLNTGLTGDLQVKEEAGGMRVLGRSTLRYDEAIGAPVCWLDGRAFVARSLRVSRRVHHTFAEAGVGDAAAAEAMRVTVDLERHLFQCAAGRGLTFLGEMGPRIEIKGPTLEMVRRVRERIDPERVLRRMPNRSLELLFGALLREIVSPAPTGFPEAETKFDVRGELDRPLVERLIAGLGNVRMLLPVPHGLERMRRYHVCLDPRNDADECIVVETAAGRLSEKRKRAARWVGRALLRETIASRTTDRDGSRLSLEEFLAERGLVRVNGFEKVQSKVPFVLENGHAYLVSFDRCVQVSGPMLQQVELEFIGTTSAFGANGPEAEVVARELEMLGTRLLNCAAGGALVASSCSKYAFFRSARPL